MLRSLILLGLLAPALSAATRTGTSAAVFLKLAGDARSRGMAEATVALPAAWNAGWAGPGNLQLNPAGLAGSLKPAFAFSQQKLAQDVQHGLLQASRAFGPNLSLALAASWVQAEEQEITTLEQPEGTGRSYDYGDLALGLAAGYRLTDRLAVGGALRMIRQELHNEEATGLGVDLGLLLETGWRKLRLGMAAANFGSRMQLEGEDLLQPAQDGRPAYLETGEFQLPLSFRVGLSDELWRSGRSSVLGVVQALHVNDNRESLALGAEYSLDGRFQLRAGHHFGRDLESWSAGLGLRLGLPGGSELILDYAYTERDYLPALQQLSLSLLP